MASQGLERRPARWPWAVFVGFLVTAGTASVFVVRNGESFAEQVPYIVAFSMFGAVGAVIVSRERRNRIGLLLLWTSGITAASFCAQEVSTYLVRSADGRGFVVGAIGVFGTAGWLFGILPAIFLLPILFPTGTPHSRRWRPLPWIVIGSLAFLAIGVLFGTQTLTDANDVSLMRNPLYVPALHVLAPVWNSEGWFPALLVAAGASQVMRFVASTGTERQQIKWFAFAIVVFVVYLVASDLAGFTGLAESIASGAAFTLLPAAIGVSILQFRLWDLDVVVKKTVVAGSLVLVALVVYGLAVAMVPTILDLENPVFVFAVALVLGIAFRPAMRVARRVADRLVYGERATPYEVLTEFSARLGTSYGTEDVLPRMAQILGEGTGAAAAHVWLRDGAQLRETAAWPAEAGRLEAIPSERLEGRPAGQDVLVEVRDRGELLGALSVRMLPADPITPAREKLVRDLAAQAGLVLRNVRLVQELRASRQRLVAAQDAERRRLERDIHDGAQQQLVALTVKARLARQLLERDPRQAGQLLGQIEGETQTALEDLRDLARGIYPPLLADEGLVAALRAQARKAPVRVLLEAQDVGRYAADVEATVYFCTLEALQNVSKYAGTQEAVVRLGQSNGTLSFTIADDGRGFDPGAVRSGSGLQGMADRLAAVGGSLDVRSSEGTGTTVTGLVPVTTR